MNTNNVVFTIIWLVVFFTSLAEFGALTAAIGATLIASVVWLVCEKKRRR